MEAEEGSVRIVLPSEPVEKGPGTRTVGFYNSSQRINRDLTELFLYVRKPKRFLDAFGGSGIRGIRVSKELGTETVISEINPVSFKIISENIRRNHSEAIAYNESFERTLERGLFDFIDIDPYGSVLPYLDKALLNVKNGGFVGVTATDLSSLTGSVAAKTRRRYGAYISNDSFRHEMGIRLLLSTISKRAASFDLAVEPEVSFWHSHFYRIIFRVRRGAGRADESLKNTGMVNKQELLFHQYCNLVEGPVWKGQIGRNVTLREMADAKLDGISMNSREKLLLLPGEDNSILYLELSDMARFSRSNVPPLLDVMEELGGASLPSARTHFSYTGLKISGDMREAHRLIGELLTRKYRTRLL